MKNKTGQFYITAATIIIIILAGVASIKTYAVIKPEPKTITDLRAKN